MASPTLMILAIKLVISYMTPTYSTAHHHLSLSLPTNTKYSLGRRYKQMKTKKSLGQNFLRDEKILRKIADFAQIEKGDTVVEVGPGEGTLTKFILEKAGKVIAIEKDESLAEKLKERFKEVKKERLEIIVGDILAYNLKTKNHHLVGNIPYYITGEIFRKFLESENQPKSLTFVVQKEVADRIMTRDGKESILSISIKAYGKPEYGGVIKAGSFVPRPKVDSAIIAVRNISKGRFKQISPPAPLTLRGEPKKTTEELLFFEIVRKGFAHKRKLLIRNLNISKDIFEKLEIPEKARAEDLKVEDWFALAKSFK